MPDILQTLTDPTIPRALVDDIFTRPDAASLGAATYVGGTWNVVAPGATAHELIDNEQAGLGASASATVLATIDAGTNAVEVTTKIGAGSVSSTWLPILFAYTDADNYWCLTVNGQGRYTIRQIEAGAGTNRGASSVNVKNGDTIRLRSNPALGLIEVYVNGLLAFSQTSGVYEAATGTRVGFGQTTGTPDNGRRWVHFRAEAA